MITLVLFLSILVSSIHCTPCSTQTVTTFPFIFTNTSLDVNQDCTYTINYSTDEYLNIYLTFNNFTSEDQIVISNSFGDKVQNSGSSSWTYSYNQPPTQTTIRIKTGGNSQPFLSIQVFTIKFSLSNVINANQYNVSSSPAILSRDAGTLITNSSYTFTSNTKVVLSAVKFSLSYDTNALTGIFIYEGQGPTAKLLGTALSGNSEVYRNSWLSTGNVLTILVTSIYPGYTYLIGNDAAYVEQYGIYDTTWCYRNDDGQHKTYRLNADVGSKASAVTVANVLEAQINGIAFSDPTATLTVLAGPPAAEELQIIQYKPTDNITSQLPQKLPGTLRTFVLDKGYANINISNDAQGDGSWSYIRDGRKGMIWSPNYPYSNTYQDIQPVSFTQGSLISQKTYVYNLTVLQSVSAPNARFVLQAVNGTRFNTINSTFAALSQKTMSVQGQNMSLSVDIGNYTTNGVAFQFQMTAVDVPPTETGKGLSVLWLCILPLWQLIGF